MTESDKIPLQADKPETKRVPRVYIDDAGGVGMLFGLALLVAFIFSFANGNLTSSISQSFSSTVDYLNHLNSSEESLKKQ